MPPRLSFSPSSFSIALFVLNAVPAHAASPGYAFAGSFTGSGTDALSAPSDVAVDQSNDDVYVADPPNHRIEKFDEEGNFILMFGKEVNKTEVKKAGSTEAQQDVCTAASGDTCQPGTEGTSPGAFVCHFTSIYGEPEPSHLFLAVDNSSGGEGDLYVGDPGDSIISKFTPEGRLIESWGSKGQLHGSSATGTGTLESGSTTIKSVTTATGAFSAGQQISAPGIPAGTTITAVNGAGSLEIAAPATASGSVSLSAQRPFPHLYGIGVVDTTGTLYALSEEGRDTAANMFEFTQSAGFTKNLLFGEGNEQSPIGIAVYPNGDFDYSFGSGIIAKLNSSGEVLIGSVTQGRHRYPTGIAVDPTTDDIYVDEGTEIASFSSSGTFFEAFSGYLNDAEGLAVTSTGIVYAANPGSGNVAAFEEGIVPEVTTGPVENPGQTFATLTGHVDPASGETTKCYFEYGTTTAYKSGRIPCAPATPYTSAQDVTANLSGLTPETTYHYRLVASNGKIIAFGSDETVTPHAVKELTTEAASVEPTSATLNGSFIGNGEETHYHFEYVTGEHFNHEGFAHATEAPKPEANAGSATGLTKVQADIQGLLQITEYHFRSVAGNHVGTTVGNELVFTTPPSAPLITVGSAADAHSESVLLRGRINPGGAKTTYHFEYGTGECSAGACTKAPIPDLEVGSGNAYQSVSTHLTGLTPATTYHYRVIATNKLGTTAGPENTFTTFPYTAEINDTCPNALARQQTGAALLLDCRAYELVSAANTGGYDVESSLVPGQSPYAGYPQASGATGTSRVLYGVHDGAIPGVAGDPTNRGVDPYIATRGADGWSTTYLGIPADNPFAAAPFSSVPTGADASLDTFAFGGAGGCSPCFEGGYTGIPVRLPGGEEVVQGMVPAPGFEPGPTATPDGYIAHDLSAGGEHLIFGSTSRFAAGGNDETGDVSIYDRNLATHETHVLSDDPAGHPLSCIQGEGQCSAAHHDSGGIAELAVSADGSHVLLGQKVSEDADHNVYYHLYMDIGDSEKSIDLTPGVISEHGGPGFAEGVLFDGMSADGSRVFFTTKDKLTADDTDESADIYAAEVSGESASLTRISTGEGGAGNTDACEAVENANGPHWNTVGPEEENCSVLAIGGGGGVAEGNGSIYFLSPEQLQAGKGVQDQPNLYLAAPGEGLRFIATLSPEDPVVLDALREAGTRHTADFQTTPSGRFAVFTSTLPLSGYQSEGHAEVYRYDAVTEALACASCNPTNETAASDATLASDGQSLTEDGRVFFNSTDPLVLRATNARQNVYEWEPSATGTCGPENPDYFAQTGDCLSLISSGQSPFDSSLLGASADGTDVFFFTHDSLAPQDRNGAIAKLYDARADGGFFVIPESPLCASSDECHGPGSKAPPPQEVRTHANAPSGNATEPGKSSKANPCKPGFLVKHGRCVRKPKPHRHHKRKHHRGGRK